MVFGQEPLYLIKMSRNFHYIILFALLGSGLQSCDVFVRQSSSSKNHVARVNDIYLGHKKIEEALPDNLNEHDSTVFVKNYIRRWATQQLLLEGAKRNLSDQKQDDFEKLVKDYRQALYTESYKDQLIAKEMDTAISKKAIKKYYDQNKKSFTLNSDLAQVRFIELPKDYHDKDEVKKAFKRYDDKDEKQLKNKALTFQESYLNDSTWIRAKDLRNRVTPLRDKKKDDYLKKDKYLSMNDSISLYLVFIKDVRLRDEVAPMEYVKPSIKENIRNKRKLRTGKKIEKDITKDAIEDNKFEVY